MSKKFKKTIKGGNYEKFPPELQVRQMPVGFNDPKAHKIKSTPNSVSDSDNVQNDGIMNLEEAFDQIKNAPSKKYLYKGIIDGPGLTLLIGQAKSGKTIFLENLLYQLAIGTGKFGDEVIQKNKDVMFISLEESFVARIGRMKSQIDGLKQEGYSVQQIMKKIKVADEEFPRYIHSKEDLQKVKKLIAKYKPDVLVIDSLSRMYSGAIEKSEVAQELMQQLKDFSDNAEIPIVVIHHTTKLYGKIASIDDMAGSRFLQQEAENVIAIGRTKSGIRYVKPLVYRYADDSFDKVETFTIDNNCLVKFGKKMTEKELENGSDGRTSTANKDKIESFMKSVRVCDPKVLKLCMQMMYQMKRTTFTDNLKKLKDDGTIIKCSDGLFRHKHYPTCPINWEKIIEDAYEEE